MKLRSFCGKFCDFSSLLIFQKNMNQSFYIQNVQEWRLFKLQQCHDVFFKQPLIKYNLNRMLIKSFNLNMITLHLVFISILLHCKLFEAKTIIQICTFTSVNFHFLPHKEGAMQRCNDASLPLASTPSKLSFKSAR